MLETGALKGAEMRKEQRLHPIRAAPAFPLQFSAEVYIGQASIMTRGAPGILFL